MSHATRKKSCGCNGSEILYDRQELLAVEAIFEVLVEEIEREKEPGGGVYSFFLDQQNSPFRG